MYWFIVHTWGEEDVDLREDGLIVWDKLWERWMWVMKWQLIDLGRVLDLRDLEREEREIHLESAEYSLPTPNELEQWKEEEEAILDTHGYLFQLRTWKG
jgi:hypothetical protein